MASNVGNDTVETSKLYQEAYFRYLKMPTVDTKMAVENKYQLLRELCPSMPEIFKDPLGEEGIKIKKERG